MASRTLAIGDVHGCYDALVALIAAIAPTSADTVVMLGDLIDRGPDSRRVLDEVIALGRRCQVVALMGNHEERLLEALQDSKKLATWLQCGGTETLRSYGWAPGGPRRRLADWIPEHHRTLLSRSQSYFETATHLFIHAGYVPELPMDQQPGLALRWRVTDPRTARPHCSGKTVVAGHTAQSTGEVLDLGYLVCIDTNCVRGGWLTALDASTGRLWQADRAGRLRSADLE